MLGKSPSLDGALDPRKTPPYPRDLPQASNRLGDAPPHLTPARVGGTSHWPVVLLYHLGLPFLELDSALAIWGHCTATPSLLSHTALVWTGNSPDHRGPGARWPQPYLDPQRCGSMTIKVIGGQGMGQRAKGRDKRSELSWLKPSVSYASNHRAWGTLVSLYLRGTWDHRQGPSTSLTELASNLWGFAWTHTINPSLPSTPTPVVLTSLTEATPLSRPSPSQSTQPNPDPFLRVSFNSDTETDHSCVQGDWSKFCS